MEVGIESLKEANDSLIEVIDELKSTNHLQRFKPVKQLSGKLQGILNPAVQGGISNYEKV